MLLPVYEGFDKLLVMVVAKNEQHTVMECLFFDGFKEFNVAYKVINETYPQERFDYYKLPVTIDACIDFNNLAKYEWSTK